MAVNWYGLSVDTKHVTLALEVFLEDGDHVVDHVVEPGVEVPAAVLAVFVYVQACGYAMVL